ncbi:MAG: prephenate dehydrogenase [Gemmatimonadaceae bacterium]
MSQPEEALVGIVGLGAIGASLALSLRGRVPVIAWSRDRQDVDAAREAGIDVHDGDEREWTRAMHAATIVVIAVPLDQIPPVLRELRPCVRDDALLLHTASLQRRDALLLSDEEFSRILATHPIAGSERSGFAASREDMFRDATVRADDRARPLERARIESLWRTAGCARIVWGDPALHDELMSWMSHLPQLAATALGASLADHGVRQDELGPGARAMTRLAASDPEMWRALLERAPSDTATAARKLSRALAQLAEALERRDAAAVARVWERARTWRLAGEDPS